MLVGELTELLWFQNDAINVRCEDLFAHFVEIKFMWLFCWKMSEAFARSGMWKH